MSGLSKTPIDVSDEVVRALCSLFDSYCYTKYRMSKFEEYDLYSKNKDFLISDSVITFNDAGGRLMALKPDVTLSMIKNCEIIPGFCQKLYYNEKVYRPSGAARSFREITQTGLECIGEIDLYTLCEVLSLASMSLKTVSDDYVIDVGHVGILNKAFDECGVGEGLRDRLTGLIGEKNLHELRAVCKQNGVSEKDADRLSLFITEYGKASKVLPVIKKAFFGGRDEKVFDVLESVVSYACQNGKKERVRIDFSVVANTKYYNGIVFKGFIRECSDAVLSGGQYGTLVRRMGKDADALGFAVYVDEIVGSYPVEKKYDADVLILYDEDTDPDILRKTSLAERVGNKRVLTERNAPEKFRAGKTVDLRKKGSAK